MRPYRVPIIVAALAVLAMAFWAWQAWRSIGEHEREMNRRLASGVFGAVEGSIRALGDHGRYSRNQVQRVLSSLVRNTPLALVVVEQGGKRIVQTGDVPEVLPLTTDSGEVFTNDLSIFWRKVRFQDTPQTDVQPAEAAADKQFDLTLSASDQMLVLGIRPPPDRRGIRGPVREMIVTLIGAILFIGASTIAWTMTIRRNLLAEQLEIERARHEHLEELGMAAAGLAHETKNPLGIILGLAQQIARNPREPEESRAMVEHVIDEVDKAAARLGDFMTFARQRKADPAPLDVRRVAEKVGTILQPDFDSAGVTLALDCPSVSVLADEEMLQQVLVNLLLNSLRASAAGTTVTVGLARQGSLATLTVADQGSGIPSDVLPNICKPYVTGRADGHGLGLAIVKRLVEEHGWRLRVASQVGQGTSVAVSGIRLSPTEEAGT